MAQFFPPLPEPRPANVMGSALAGYGAIQQVQNEQTRNALAQMQLGKEQAGQSALEEYRTTGDIEKLKTANPKQYAEIVTAEAHKKKAELDAMKPGLDLAYTLSGIATPENYGELRDHIEKTYPALGKGLPRSYDPNAIKNFRQSYERMKKLEDPYKQGHLEEEQKRTDIQRRNYETDAQYKLRIAGLREQEVGIHGQKLDIERGKAGKTGGAWFASPDGKQSRYFTPASPPPENWRKVGGKEAPEDQVTETRDEEGNLIKTTTKKKVGSGQAKPTGDGDYYESFLKAYSVNPQEALKTAESNPQYKSYIDRARQEGKIQ